MKMYQKILINKSKKYTHEKLKENTVFMGPGSYISAAQVRKESMAFTSASAQPVISTQDRVVASLRCKE